MSHYSPSKVGKCEIGVVKWASAARDVTTYSMPICARR